MQYDIDADAKARLRERLARIPELSESEVEQMTAFAASVVAGRVEVVEAPRTEYERRFTPFR